MPREAGEPTAENRPVPVWLMVLLFALLYWGMVFFNQYGGWFDAEVYAPYASLTDLQAFQPRGGGFSANTSGPFMRTIAGCAMAPMARASPAKPRPTWGPTG